MLILVVLIPLSLAGGMGLFRSGVGGIWIALGALACAIAGIFWLEWQLGLFNLINYLVGVPINVHSEPCPGFDHEDGGKILSGLALLLSAFGLIIVMPLGWLASAVGAVIALREKDTGVLKFGSTCLLIGAASIVTAVICGRIIFANGWCYYT